MPFIHFVLWLCVFSKCSEWHAFSIVFPLHFTKRNEYCAAPKAMMSLLNFTSIECVFRALVIQLNRLQNACTRIEMKIEVENILSSEFCVVACVQCYNVHTDINKMFVVSDRTRYHKCMSSNVLNAQCFHLNLHNF